jgi:Tfp pilus assembly protein PilF
MKDELDRILAMRIWKTGYRQHLKAIALAARKRKRAANDKLEMAIAFYSTSIIACPTAQAHTFRGWAYRLLGRIDDAIAECKRAIELDPKFGNPYNDIGAYLIARRDLDEAIEWFEKAKTAPNYEPRHFPYMNLGQLYSQKGMVFKAITELEEALRIAPANDPATAPITSHLTRLRAMLN